MLFFPFSLEKLSYITFFSMRKLTQRKRVSKQIGLMKGWSGEDRFIGAAVDNRCLTQLLLERKRTGVGMQKGNASSFLPKVIITIGQSNERRSKKAGL